MNQTRRNMSPSQAASYLRTSVKALRVYEQHELIAPGRNTAGWRVYTHEDIKRAEEVISLRNMGLSISKIRRVLEGESSALLEALKAQEIFLEGQAHHIAASIEKVRAIRCAALDGRATVLGDLTAQKRLKAVVGFELPWPWGGEWFELHIRGSLNFITGPLGSGKTRFATRLAEILPKACFLGLDRAAFHCIDGDRLRERVATAQSWLCEDEAEPSDALTALIFGIEACKADFLVIDMVEQDLDATTQRALVSYLRARPEQSPALFLMTRSTAILDLDATHDDETIVYCPANHAPPFIASGRRGGFGHESLSTCLADPEVRARTRRIVVTKPSE